MAIDPIADVRAFQASFNRAYILERSVPPGKLEPLLRPFRWWQPAHRFDGFEHTLRAATALLGAVLARRQAARDSRRRLEQLLRVAEFLTEYQAGGDVVGIPEIDPLDDFRETARYALEHLPAEGSVLEGAPQGVRDLHEGWTGIVRAEVLALDDRTILAAFADACDALIQTKNTTYNVVRGCGDQHLEYLGGELETLLPADQLYFLHALDAFPSSVPVAAFLRAYAARTELEFLREGAERYAARVEAGEKTTGF